jgi:hypothetical protein
MLCPLQFLNTPTKLPCVQYGRLFKDCLGLGEVGTIHPALAEWGGDSSSKKPLHCCPKPQVTPGAKENVGSFLRSTFVGVKRLTTGPGRNGGWGGDLRSSLKSVVSE